jgi:hypothetical protein
VKRERHEKPEPRTDDGIGGEVMKLKEIASYLNCHYTTVYRWPCGVRFLGCRALLSLISLLADGRLPCNVYYRNRIE